MTGGNTNHNTTAELHELKMEAAQTHAYGIAGIHPGAAIPQEGLREVAAILHLKLLFGHAKLVTSSDAALN